MPSHYLYRCPNGHEELRYRNARLCRECHTPVTRVDETPAQPKLRDVRRLRLAPDDYVLVTLREALPLRNWEGYIQYLQRVFPDNRIVVLQNDAKLEVITPEVTGNFGAFADPDEPPEYTEAPCPSPT